LKPGSLLAPNLAILFSAVLWGTLWIPLRQLHEAAGGGPLATTMGFLLPLILLLPAATRGWRRIVGRGSQLGMVGLCLASSIALYAEGLVRGEVARVILLFYLTPVWSTLLGRLLLGEPITRRRVTTICLGLGGLAVILGVGVRIPLPASAAEWMGLSAGLTWALSLVYMHRTASSPSVDRVFVLFLFLAPIFFLVTLIPGRGTDVTLGARSLLDSAPWLVALAGVWMLPVVWLTVFGASRLDPGRVAICLMLEVVVGLTTAALLTDEPLGVREILGAILIMSASGVEMTAPQSAQGSTPRAE
jgi:drug/metabolite transporter (DMT)-like permease